LETYLLISNLRLQDVNSSGSAYTIGFPAMTAWLGAVHAMQRSLNEKQGLESLKFTGVAVVCHKQYQQISKHEFSLSMMGTGNPLTEKGTRSSFIEEGRCNLQVSLLIACENLNRDIDNTVEMCLSDQLMRMKVAGGTAFGFGDITSWYPDDEEKTKRDLMRRLMPGYIIIERRDLMKQESDADDRDALDRLLYRLQVASSLSESDDKHWKHHRNQNGWIVPLAVGFRDLSGSLAVRNQRSTKYDHHFVEPVLTLGEFVLPYRCGSIQNMIWRYQYNEEQGLYVCVNQQEKENE